MSTGIKGGKSKFVGTIIGLIILTMILSFLSVYFIANPGGLICLILICIFMGFILRKLVLKKIDNFVDKL